MKIRTAIAVLTGTLALAAVGGLVPLVATAGFPGGIPNQYEGKIAQDLTADFGFDVHRRPSGKRFARNFDLDDVPFACRDGSIRRQSQILNDPSFIDPNELRIRHGRFDGTIQQFLTGYTVELEGELLSGGRARGALRMSTQSSEPAGSCYSGLLDWEAAK